MKRVQNSIAITQSILLKVGVLLIWAFPLSWGPALAFSWLLDLPDGPDEWLFPNDPDNGLNIVKYTWCGARHASPRCFLEEGPIVPIWIEPKIDFDPAALNNRLCMPIQIEVRDGSKTDWKTSLWITFPKEDLQLKLNGYAANGYRSQPDLARRKTKLHPATIPYWMNLAEFYRKNRQYADALVIYKRTLPFLTEHASICYVARLYDDTGRLDEIEVVLESYLKKLEKAKLFERRLSRKDVAYWFQSGVPGESEWESPFWKNDGWFKELDARRDILNLLLKSYAKRNSHRASGIEHKLSLLEQEMDGRKHMGNQ